MCTQLQEIGFDFIEAFERGKTSIRCRSTVGNEAREWDEKNSFFFFFLLLRNVKVQFRVIRTSVRRTRNIYSFDRKSSAERNCELSRDTQWIRCTKPNTICFDNDLLQPEVNLFCHCATWTPIRCCAKWMRHCWMTAAIDICTHIADRFLCSIRLCLEYTTYTNICIVYTLFPNIRQATLFRENSAIRKFVCVVILFPFSFFSLSSYYLSCVSTHARTFPFHLLVVKCDKRKNCRNCAFECYAIHYIATSSLPNVMTFDMYIFIISVCTPHTVHVLLHTHTSPITQTRNNNDIDENVHYLLNLDFCTRFQFLRLMGQFRSNMFPNRWRKCAEIQMILC